MRQKKARFLFRLPDGSTMTVDQPNFHAALIRVADHVGIKILSASEVTPKQPHLRLVADNKE